MSPCNNYDLKGNLPSSISLRVRFAVPLVVLSTIFVKPIPCSNNFRSSSAVIGLGNSPERNMHFPKMIYYIAINFYQLEGQIVSKLYLIHKIRSYRLTEMVSWSCIMMTLKSSVHSWINTNLKININK